MLGSEGMGRHDPRYDRYPDIETITDLAGDRINVVRDALPESASGPQTAVHLTHRANTDSILEEGIRPGELSSGSRHLAWRHGPKVTKSNDHINDMITAGQRVLENAREQSEFGDPSMLPENETSIGLWPTRELPEYLLTLGNEGDGPYSCMPEFVDDERIPYVGFVVDLDALNMGSFYGLPHGIKRQHMDACAEYIRETNGEGIPSREAGQLPIEYWNQCVVSNSPAIVQQEISSFSLPEIVVESSDGSELSNSDAIPTGAIETVIVPEWTDDLSNLEAPDYLPDPPAGDNHAFYMTK